MTPGTRPNRLAIHLRGGMRPGLSGLADAPMNPRLTVCGQVVSMQPGKHPHCPLLRNQDIQTL